MLCNSLFITNGNLLQRIEERLYFFIRKSSNSLSCIFCPSRFLQKRLLRRSWLESGHGWLAPRVAIGCHRFLVQPARFQRGRACSTIIVRVISTSWTDLHFHCENIFNLKLTLTQIDFMESNSPALLCPDVQKWVKCDNRVKPVQMFSNLIGSPMINCKSDKVVINKKILAWKTNSCPTLAAFRPNL